MLRFQMLSAGKMAHGPPGAGVGLGCGGRVGQGVGGTQAGGFWAAPATILAIWPRVAGVFGRK